MGYTVLFLEFPCSVSKEEIIASVAQNIQLQSDPGEDRFISVDFREDTHYPDRSAAAAFLTAQGGMAAVAVRYDVPLQTETIPADEQETVARLKELQREFSANTREIERMKTRSFFDSCADRFIVCEYCESRINLNEYLNAKAFVSKDGAYLSDYCPICGHSLLPGPEIRRRKEFLAKSRQTAYDLSAERDHITARTAETEPYWLIRAVFRTV